MALLSPLIAAPIMLAPRTTLLKRRPAPAVDETEQARTIEAMRPPKRQRPLIAIVARNEGTEVADFLVAFGILRRVDVADVIVVAKRAEPVRLYPSLGIEPETTMAGFDERHPDGADYVVVPAMDPGNDRLVANWIAGQFRKNAGIVSICNGSRMVATAGLLDGRRATAHWSAVPKLRRKHPSMTWVRDRRYVSDSGVTTSTGISASIPVMLALVEAIGGREIAARVARDLGVTNWDARHLSSSFVLTREHKKTFMRNALTFWRRETIGIPVVDKVDEVALGLTIDAYSRTYLARVITLWMRSDRVRSRHGLVLRPDQSIEEAAVDDMLPALPSYAPAMTLERELPRIAARYDPHTAAIVALVMEYPWP
jgi:transcriptional regulator GlxA family with amidase domain